MYLENESNLHTSLILIRRKRICIIKKSFESFFNIFDSKSWTRDRSIDRSIYREPRGAIEAGKGRQSQSRNDGGIECVCPSRLRRNWAVVSCYLVSRTSARKKWHIFQGNENSVDREHAEHIRHTIFRRSFPLISISLSPSSPSVNIHLTSVRLLFPSFQSEIFFYFLVLKTVTTLLLENRSLELKLDRCRLWSWNDFKNF